jgi:hypothetical protein
VATAGVVTVNVTGNVARGDYLRTSTSAGYANTAGTAKTAGSFARALTAYSGGSTGTVTAVILQSVTGLDTFDGQNYQGGNLLKNFPSLELADAAQPEWWEEQNANITLTEEDATGEGIADKYERVLKCVNGGSGGGVYFYQRLTYADENITDPSNTIISAGVWVYTASAGTITLDIQDSAGGSLGTATTTATGSWQWLQVVNKTLGAGTYVEFRLKHSANSATFYVIMPMLNQGAKVRPWEERRLRFVEKKTNAVLNTDPGASSWADLDLTSSSSNNAALFFIIGSISRTSGTPGIFLRRNGSSAAADLTTKIGTSTPAMGNILVLGDDGQIIEWYCDDYVGCTNVTLSIAGYWEWA